MTQRTEFIQKIEARLTGHKLVYFGTRGVDARPLLELEALSDVFCQIAPLRAGGIAETCLESITKRRVDLDSYSIDQDQSEAVQEIRARLLSAFSRRAAVLPYRPTALLTSAWFPRSRHVKHLGVFHEHQACFEHKPWVETQLRNAGVNVIEWFYHSDLDIRRIREIAERGPVVLRANRSDGGAGITLIEDPADVERLWPAHADGFLATASYLAPSIPLNLNCCVFPGGQVTFHGPSVQLIGIKQCTTRRFGYCGNDFAAAKNLTDPVLDELEKLGMQVGRWLSRNGYLGAFGIDALCHDGLVYLTEVNPRFQGSSRVTAELDAALGLSDIFLHHAASFLGLSPPPQQPLRELTRATPARAHVVCHNLLSVPAEVTSEGVRLGLPPHDVLPAAGETVDPDAVLGVVHFDASVTTDGSDILPHAQAMLDAVIRAHYGLDLSRLAEPRADSS